MLQIYKKKKIDDQDKKLTYMFYFSKLYLLKGILSLNVLEVIWLKKDLEK